jgi:hypothetical protein
MASSGARPVKTSAAIKVKGGTKASVNKTGAGVLFDHDVLDEIRRMSRNPSGDLEISWL